MLFSFHSLATDLNSLMSQFPRITWIDLLSLNQSWYFYSKMFCNKLFFTNDVNDKSYKLEITSNCSIIDVLLFISFEIWDEQFLRCCHKIFSWSMCSFDYQTCLFVITKSICEKKYCNLKRTFSLNIRRIKLSTKVSFPIVPKDLNCFITRPLIKLQNVQKDGSKNYIEK